MKRLSLLLVALALLLCGCSGAAPAASGEPAQREFFAMDTYMSLKAYGASRSVMEGAQALVEQLEAELSVTAETSAIHRLNETGETRLSPGCAALLRRALDCCELTGGALDVTVYPVLRAWGFTTGEYRVPEAAEIRALLERVDWRNVTLSEDGTVRLPRDAELDLGAVTKGWTGDRLCDYLRGQNVKSALLDLGGNVQALGEKPDGSPWRIGVRDPAGEGLLGVLAVRDEAVVTSGGYERYFEDEEGNLWWHILDPAEGYPARNGLISVTVVGPEGVYCDALSTALFVLGPERAVEFWRAHGEVELMLVTEDGRLLLTPALAERFGPDAAIPYRVEVIPDA